MSKSLSQISRYRVFPDYVSTGVWNQIGSAPYVIEYDDLTAMGIKSTTIELLKVMQLIYEIEPSEPALTKPVADYLEYLGQKIVARLNQEAPQATFTWEGVS